MDLTLELAEAVVDSTVTDFLRARFKVRPMAWKKDYPTKGTRSLATVIKDVQPIEQKLKVYKGLVFKDTETGRMFHTWRENNLDSISLINAPDKGAK
jgi:hypothetical protein